MGRRGREQKIQQEFNNNAFELQMRKNRKSIVLEARMGCRSKTITPNRLSFSAESAVNVRPILRIAQTPVCRAARRISRNARRIRFKSHSVVIDITPLPDKPAGVVRMPYEEDEEEESSSDEEMEVLDDNKENTISSRLLNKPLRRSAAMASGDANELIKFLPIDLNLDINESASESIAESSSTSRMEPIQINSNAWSVEENEAYELAIEFSKDPVKVKSELYSTAFAPTSRNELFNNVSRLYAWLEQWRKRLSTQLPIDKRKNKRKRKSTIYDDDDYEVIDRELPNPFIISGPCGSGKTSAVYCAALEHNMKVIEFSTAERRNGAAFEKRLQGAINSHYICASKSCDIRQMFSPKVGGKSTSSNTQTGGSAFSVALIDDCDIIYPNDDNFWSSLRTICDDAKIPIILTCTNFDYVKKMLTPGFLGGYSESLHFVQQTVLRLSRHLRAWLVGYKQKLVSFEWLKSVIEAHHADLRAVLNYIQFNMRAKRLEDCRKRKPTVKPDAPSLKVHLRRMRALSALDAEFGVPVGAVTWRASANARLDALPNAALSLRDVESESETLDDCVPLRELLEAHVDETDSLLNYRFSINQPLKVIRDARMRSRPRMLYSWKSVALDYLPCLWAIDEHFHNAMQNRSKRDEVVVFSGSTTRTRNKNSYNDRVQHPFDEYNQATGLAIDTTEELRLSISKYTFSNLYRPTY